MLKTPPSLKKGDIVGLVCPAGQMPVSRMQTCMRVLEKEWGFRVLRGKTLGTRDTYFSGTDEERLADLQQMLDDDSVKAILCARGGYGVSRLIDRIDFSHFVKQPKWIIGFSDITALHMHIYKRYRISTLHAPMAGAFNDGGWRGPSVQSLYHALTGNKNIYDTAVHPFNREGKASGPLIGGNLALMAHLVGTKSFPATAGSILFLEDVGEQLYNIDRMMRQLLRAGKLSRLSGLVIGGFTECKDTEKPFGRTAYDIIREVTGGFRYPICFGFPVSHGKHNVALKTGRIHFLQVNTQGVRLKEL